MLVSDVVANLNLSGIRTTNTTDTEQSVRADGNARLANMANGETFTGEVISKNGDTATIRLMGGEEINALLSKDMNIMEGKNVTFQVVSNNGDAVAIRTLFNNNSQELIAMNALKEAGIEANPKSMLMMSDLLNNNMPIDKGSLSAMYSKILSNPDIDQSNMVNLAGRGFELNADNLGKLNALVNFEERVSSTVSSLIDDIPKEMTNMLNEGDIKGAVKLFTDISNAINGTLGEAGAEGKAIDQTVADSASETAKVIISDAGENVVQTTNPDVKNVITEEPFMEIAANGEAVNAGTEKVLTEGDLATPKGADNGQIAGTIKAEDAVTLSNILKEINPNINVSAEDILNGNIDNAKLMSEIAKALGEDPEAQSHMKSLMDNETFNGIMKGELKDMWLLNPEKMAKEGDISEYYTKLNNQIHAVAQSMSETLSSSGNLSQALNNLSQNLEFLNDLNQFVAYVQLPLNMEGEAASGDLYVFANKKNLAEKEDNLTALLHLNMEYLGPLDVYVKLSADTHISTNFTVASDEILDLLEAHMDMLTDRLKDKGYSLENQFNVSDETTDINSGFSKLLEDKNGEKPKDIISYNGFDVRA